MGKLSSYPTSQNPTPDTLVPIIDGGENKNTPAGKLAGLTSGFIDYNDATGEIVIPSGEFVDVPNNLSGPNTNTQFSPHNVDSIMDSETGYLNFSDLSLGDEIFMRIDFKVFPAENNSFLDCRMLLGGGAEEYPLNVFSKKLSLGAGIEYPSEKGLFYIYMGDENTLNNPGKLQVKLSGGGVLLNAGVAISIKKY